MTDYAVVQTADKQIMLSRTCALGATLPNTSDQLDGLTQSRCSRRQATAFEQCRGVPGGGFRFLPLSTHALERHEGKQLIAVPLGDDELIRMNDLDAQRIDDLGRKVANVR